MTTNCSQLKMESADGKMYLTDVADCQKATKTYTIQRSKKENLRDNMTNTELTLNMLAEASTKDFRSCSTKDF